MSETTQPRNPATAQPRLVSLDAFRGLTIAGMLLVNDPGSWSAIYAPLEHAEWHGWTPTDLVFPFFLFIVGITTHLSRKEPKAILRRGALIVLCGLLLNAYPFFWWGKIAANPDPTFLQRVVYRFAHLRFMGVLQRIGIVYAISALIARSTNARQKAVVIAAILVGYWAIMMFGPLAPPEATVAAAVDRAVLGINHIWSSTKTWDPEGPLSTIPAIATALFGVLAGEWISRKEKPLVERIAGLFGAGSIALFAGSLWGWLFPINKNLWTSSYVVFTAGFACVVLAACMWLIDFMGVRAWAKPFVIYGTNPLVAFVGSGLMARTIDSLIKVSWTGQKTSLHQATFVLFFEPFFPEKFASLLWGLCFVTLWLGILTLLYRKNIVVRL
jgi:predicted acyltransferase